MKKTIVALFVIANMMYFSSNALADQRFETNTNFCHFAGDPEDDDNEAFLSGCENSLIAHDAADGNGRLVDGTATVSHDYNLSEKTYPVWATKPNPRGYGQPELVMVLLKGADVERSSYRQHRSAVNIPCEMVTSNYNANNDDQNETVYSTNDWNLSVVWSQPYESNFDLRRLTYHLACRNGAAQ